MAIRWKTPLFRVSFPQVFKPKAFDEGSEPKYSITMLFAKDADLSELKRAVNKLKKEHFSRLDDEDVFTPFTEVKKKLRKGYEGYENTTPLTASSNRKPKVIDVKTGELIIHPEDFYPGCYAKAVVNIYDFNKSVNKGISLGLVNLIKMRDGDPLDGSTDPFDDFDDELKKPDDEDDLDDL